MGVIVENAVYQGIFLLFTIAMVPVALVFLGYLVCIVIMTIKELRKK